MFYESIHWHPSSIRVACERISAAAVAAGDGEPRCQNGFPTPPPPPVARTEGFANLPPTDGPPTPISSLPPTAAPPAFENKNINNNNLLPVTSPLREPTLIIWSSQYCSACRNSSPTFRALEKNTDGWKVVHVEATSEVLRRYPGHLFALPTYDFLYPEPGTPISANPLAIEGARVRTVRINSPEALREVVPSLHIQPSS